MSVRTRDGAVEAFLAPLQRAVSCVTREILVRSPVVPGQPRAVRFREEAVRLRGRNRLEHSVRLECTVEQVGDQARFVANLAGYRYELAHADGPMILAYHWHPVGVSPITMPHLHLGGQLMGIDVSKAHLPTGIVTLQAVLRFAIDDLGVAPLRDDWREVLAA